jgi:hypothetical protein
MPLQTSDDILVSRDHQKHKWHYWITENFRSPVSEEMYYEFPTGELVHVQHTHIYRKVFTMSYNTNKGVLIWKRSKRYYFILLLPLFIAYSSYVPLSNRWDRDIGFSAGIMAIVFSGILIFFDRF